LVHGAYVGSRNSRIGSFDDTSDWATVKVYGTRLEKAR
jgi:hypothetical protein